MALRANHPVGLTAGVTSISPGRSLSRQRVRAGGRGALARRGTAALLATLWLVIVGAPIYYVAAVSLEPSGNFLTSNPWFPTGGLTIENYVTVWQSGFVTYLLNSIIVAGSATLIAIAVSLLAAHAIVHRMSRATAVAFRAFLVGFAVPIQALMIPLYIEIQRLHLYDTLLGLLLPLAAFGLPVTILVLVNFLREVPRELTDAMSIDGAGQLRILRSLVVPLSWPALITVAIFDFVTAWNNFLFPLVLTQSANKATLPLAIFNFQGAHLSIVPNIMASVALTSAPLVLAYLVARRRILSGLAGGFGS